MYPLRLVELTRLDDAFAAGEGPKPHLDDDRTSDVRIRNAQEDDVVSSLLGVQEDDDASGLRLARAADESAAERETVAPPPRTTKQPPAGGIEALDEVLFRFSCGDFDGALAAAEVLMTSTPVIIMPRAELRSEPLGYWALLLLARIDGEANLSDLLTDVPSAEAVRVVCELLERRIIALR